MTITGADLNKTLFDLAKVPVPGARATWVGATKEFISGDMAFHDSGSWQVQKFASQIGTPINREVIPAPCGPAEAFAYRGYGNNRAMFNIAVTRLTQVIVGEMKLNDALARATDDLKQALAAAN